MNPTDERGRELLQRIRGLLLVNGFAALLPWVLRVSPSGAGGPLYYALWCAGTGRHITRTTPRDRWFDVVILLAIGAADFRDAVETPIVAVRVVRVVLGALVLAAAVTRLISKDVRDYSNRNVRPAGGELLSLHLNEAQPKA